MRNRILLVYTGGTIGMNRNPHTGALEPFDFEHLLLNVPELKQFDIKIDTYQFEPPIDSSDMSPAMWTDISHCIADHYDDYDGFVVLHGTDTMAYTASALSFMFENLSKPIILTGSQLPMGMLRSDGRENLICALELAAGKEQIIPEVCLYFESHLYRGNRSTKVSAENFDAFSSYNYPSLVKAGISFTYKPHLFLLPTSQPLKVHKCFDRHIAVLKMFPGITPEVVGAVLHTENLRGVVLETFGSGNAPTEPWFIDAVEEAIRRNIVVLNVTQCKAGAVKMGQYEAGVGLQRIGVIGGNDLTPEAAVTKLMFLLGMYPDDNEAVKRDLQQSLRGEMTVLLN